MAEVICPVCGRVFSCKRAHVARNISRGHSTTCSKECAGIGRRKKLLTCYYCQKEFKPSRYTDRTKSGRRYCSRRCLGLATRTVGYRRAALDTFEHKCVICGYAENIKMLDVDHIDGNHQNHDLSNLQLLCGWCHLLKTRGVTWHSWGASSTG